MAIVGRTGSGKSTLLRLDGVDLRELPPAALRRRIGFVPQETFLFSAT